MADEVNSIVVTLQGEAAGSCEELFHARRALGVGLGLVLLQQVLLDEKTLPILSALPTEHHPAPNKHGRPPLPFST